MAPYAKTREAPFVKPPGYTYNTFVAGYEDGPRPQAEDLQAFGWERLFEEWTSSRKVDRPELRVAMDFWREGDELVV